VAVRASKTARPGNDGMPGRETDATAIKRAQPQDLWREDHGVTATEPRLNDALVFEMIRARLDGFPVFKREALAFSGPPDGVRRARS
jgi:hypothetical protein